MENEEKDVLVNLDESGNVNISDEVVSIISSMAAKRIDGVAGMISSITSGFAEFLGKKNVSKGVKVTIQNHQVTIDMFIIVEYGVKIIDVAWEVQEKVKSEVEAMTGLEVIAVNVNVEGVNFAKEEPTVENNTEGEKTEE